MAVNDNIASFTSERKLGKKFFELSNHLGNVLSTVSDRKLGVEGTTTGEVAYYTADVRSSQDYYPFGMLMPGRKFGADKYRFGFNGKEYDSETYNSTGTVYDYGFRIYNPRLGKFLSVDPLTRSYPWYTPYQFAGNKPIIAIDLDGLEEWICVVYKRKNVIVKYSFLHVEGQYRSQQNDATPDGTYFNWSSPNTYLVLTVDMDEHNISDSDIPPVNARNWYKYREEGDNPVTYRKFDDPMVQYISESQRIEDWFNTPPSNNDNSRNRNFRWNRSKIVLGSAENHQFFENESTVLSEEGKKKLDHYGKFLKKYNRIKINIYGNTDSDPVPSYKSKNTGATGNQGLSDDRALIVKQYFIDKGIDESSKKTPNFLVHIRAIFAASV